MFEKKYTEMFAVKESNFSSYIPNSLNKKICIIIKYSRFACCSNRVLHLQWDKVVPKLFHLTVVRRKFLIFWYYFVLRCFNNFLQILNGVKIEIVSEDFIMVFILSSNTKEVWRSVVSYKQSTVSHKDTSKECAF